MDVGPGEHDRKLTPVEREIWRSFVSGGWALLGEINAAMNANGFSQSDLRVLEFLGDSRQRGISELAAAVHMTVSTVSRQVTRLIDEGSVERAECASDGRHRHVRITDEGRRVLDQHVQVRDDMIRRLVIDQLTPEEFAMLGSVFGKIGAGISQQRDS